MVLSVWPGANGEYLGARCPRLNPGPENIGDAKLCLNDCLAAAAMGLALAMPRTDERDSISFV
jgi:hypothetical protein